MNSKTWLHPRTAIYAALVGFQLIVPPWAMAKEQALERTDRLMRILIRNQSVVLDTGTAEKGCKMNSPSGPVRTLGDYLALLTASLIPKNGQTAVTSSCTLVIGGQFCEVWFSTGVGTDSPWRYGVQFGLDITGQLDATSLRCLGGS